MAQFRFLFTATDYEAAVEFYTSAMGLPVVRAWEDQDRGTIVAAANGQIEILGGRSDAPIAGVALAWEVADVDDEYRRMAANGVEFLSPPQNRPWGHRNVRLLAPGGLSITLFTVVGDES